MSDQTKPPAWAVEAATDILYDHLERPRQQYIDSAAAIIAKHAPRPMRLRWVQVDAQTAVADSEFGSYSVWEFQDEDGVRCYMRRKGEHGGTLVKGATSLDQAKAAAQADFAERVAKCMEAGDAE